MKWFRFYSEALDDPKVQRLPGETFKAWVNLLCLANEGTPRGTLPSIEDIAFRLRLTEAKTIALIADLVNRGLLDDGDGNVTPHNWNDRQAKSDNVSERVQRHRSKQQEPVTGNVTRNVTGTVSVTSQNRVEENRRDTDTETEVEETRVRALPPAAVAETTETLLLASFVNDEPDVVERQVIRAFSLVPGFDIRDGPLEAEKFGRRNAKKPPADWYRAWLNWLKNAVKFEQERQASRPQPKQPRSTEDEYKLVQYPDGTKVYVSR